MAKIKNPHGLKGKVGDLIIYELNGIEVARRVGAIPKSKHKKSPRFRRMRENMAEFGGSSQIGRDVRLSLSSRPRFMGDPYVSGRLNSVIHGIIKNGEGKPGQREFDPAPSGGLLKGFELNQDFPLKSLLKGKFKTSISKNRKEGSVVFDPLTRKDIKAPKGATHFQFVFVLTCLSTYVFDARQNGYKPLWKPQLGKQNGPSTESSLIDLKKIPARKITLKAALVFPKEIPEYLSVLAWVGVTFLREENPSTTLLC